MTKTIFAITLLFACSSMRGQNGWNVKDRAGYIGYLTATSFMVGSYPAKPAKYNLLLELFPAGGVDFRLDSIKRNSFMKNFAIVMNDWINREDSLSKLDVSIIHPDEVEMYHYTGCDTLIMEDLEDIKKAVNRLKVVTGLLPFTSVSILGGDSGNFNIEIHLEVTGWLKKHKNFDFDEYALVLASVLYDYSLARTDMFSLLHVRYINRSSSGKKVHTYNFDLRGKVVQAQCNKHASYLSLKEFPKMKEIRRHQTASR